MKEGLILKSCTWPVSLHTEKNQEIPDAEEYLVGCWKYIIQCGQGEETQLSQNMKKVAAT